MPEPPKFFPGGQKWFEISKRKFLSKNVMTPIKLISGMCRA